MVEFIYIHLLIFPLLIINQLDVQYATVIAILFASYCPAQIPSNMVVYFLNPTPPPFFF